MSGCAQTNKKLEKWWERNVKNPVTGFHDRRLTVTSHPPQADVFINDVYQGKTPLRLKFQVSMRDILKGFVVSVQKKGYLPVSRPISFRVDRVTFRLVKRKAKK